MVLAKNIIHLEITLDNHWKYQECKYDFSVDMNTRKPGCGVKSTMIENIEEADIVADNQRPQWILQYPAVSNLTYL